MFVDKTMCMLTRLKVYLMLKTWQEKRVHEFKIDLYEMVTKKPPEVKSLYWLSQFIHS